jgi:hypothetical protein
LQKVSVGSSILKKYLKSKKEKENEEERVVNFSSRNDPVYFQLCIQQDIKKSKEINSLSSRQQ